VKRSGLAGSFWPSEQQELLLRTALREDDVALAAWLRLRPRLDLDRLEEGSIRLAPLVYRRLVQLGLEDPELPRLKGLYRRSWYENTLVLDQLVTLLKALAAAGVEPLVLDGPAIGLRYYPELALRKFLNTGLLLPEGAGEAATRALDGSEFEPLEPARRGEAAPLPYQGRNGHVFYLHREPPADLIGVDGRSPTRDWWTRARPLKLAGAQSQVPAPGDQLLATLLTGARPSEPPAIDWMADAAVILRGGDDLDWPALIGQAADCRMTLRLRESLRFLAQSVTAEVPQAVLDELERWQPTRRERLAHRLAARRPVLLGGLPETLALHLRWTSERPLPIALASLPGFLRGRWGLRRAWQLPLAAARKGLAALLRTATALVSRSRFQGRHVARRPAARRSL
jgi:hypothetical protein